MSSAGKVKSSFSFHNKPTLIRGGEPYFSKLTNLIEQSEKSIQFQVYIFEEDETGIAIAEKLIEARKRNVEIPIIDAVHQVLFENVTPLNAVKNLLNRKMINE